MHLSFLPRCDMRNHGSCTRCPRWPTSLCFLNPDTCCVRNEIHVIGTHSGLGIIFYQTVLTLKGVRIFSRPGVCESPLRGFTSTYFSGCGLGKGPLHHSHTKYGVTAAFTLLKVNTKSSNVADSLCIHALVRPFTQFAANSCKHLDLLAFVSLGPLDASGCSLGVSWCLGVSAS